MLDRPENSPPAYEPPREDICVVGGAGRVGLPLAIVLAGKGKRVLLYDINAAAIDKIRQGRMPFLARIIHDSEDTKSLLCYKHVV